MATLIATLLASASAVLIVSARTSRSVFVEEQRIEAARLQAEALAADAIVELDTGAARFPLNGSRVALSHAMGPGVVRIQDTMGLVDLNAAEPSQLTTLFAAVGLDQREAAELADRTADWRDPSGFRRPLGVQASEYAASGEPPPAGRPFATEAEFTHVLGVTPSLMDCITPYVTIFSGSPTVDLATAPPLLRHIFGGDVVNATNFGVGAPLGHVLIVTAEAPFSKHAAFRLTEWIRLTGDSRRPVMVHRAAGALVSINGETAPACQLPPASGQGA